MVGYDGVRRLEELALEVPKVEVLLHLGGECGRKRSLFHLFHYGECGVVSTLAKV
jgi:hypothetical protein